jgi:hypothetical protein
LHEYDYKAAGGRQTSKSHCRRSAYDWKLCNVFCSEVSGAKDKRVFYGVWCFQKNKDALGVGQPWTLIDRNASITLEVKPAGFTRIISFCPQKNFQVP